MQRSAIPGICFDTVWLYVGDTWLISNIYSNIDSVETDTNYKLLTQQQALDEINSWEKGFDFKLMSFDSLVYIFYNKIHEYKLRMNL